MNYFHNKNNDNNKKKENYERKYEKISIKELLNKIKICLLKKIIKSTKTKRNYLIKKKKK